MVSAGDGNDTLNGGDGDDFIFGGDTEADLRDVIFAGAGDDSVDGGHGNDQIYGQDGNDTLSGGFGADELIGQTGDDVITGGAFSDLVFGNAGADRFYYLGIEGHGSDWVQDYSAAEGDRLVYGGTGASAADFQINYAQTSNAGGAAQEAFVIYGPTDQILWALVDGAAQDEINLQIGGQVVDLMG